MLTKGEQAARLSASVYQLQGGSWKRRRKSGASGVPGGGDLPREAVGSVEVSVFLAPGTPPAPLAVFLKR